MASMRLHHPMTVRVSLSFSPWKMGTFLWLICMTGPCGATTGAKAAAPVALPLLVEGVAGLDILNALVW